MSMLIPSCVLHQWKWKLPETLVRSLFCHPSQSVLSRSLSERLWSFSASSIKREIPRIRCSESSEKTEEGISEKRKWKLPETLVRSPFCHPSQSILSRSLSEQLWSFSASSIKREIPRIRCSESFEKTDKVISEKIVEIKQCTFFQSWDVPWDWKVTLYVMLPYLMSVRCSRCLNSRLLPTVQSLRYHGTPHSHNCKNFLGLDPSNNSNSPTSHGQVLTNKIKLYNLSHQHLSRSELRCYHHSPKKLSSGSYSVLQSSGLQHWFKNWQELRKHKLTASTFGGAVGFWHGRRVQLWLEKIGLIEPFTGNLATCWSNIKEEVALERYKLITGNSVSFPEFQVYNRTNSEDDWLAASPDGVVEHMVYGLPCGGVLEVKCPLENGEVEQSFPWSRIPLHCMPQAQGLMEILDRDWMDFYVWTPNGSSLFRLRRDPEYWKLLKSALSDFWWKHVQPAKELCRMDPESDLFSVVRPLTPAPTHGLFRDIICASKCLVDESVLLVQEIHGKLQN